MLGAEKANFTGSSRVWNGWPHLTVLLFAFFAGVIAGFFLAYSRGASRELQEYLSEYFSYAARDDLQISFLSVLWDCFIWPAAIVFFSFSVLGVFMIPILILMRGFLLSYSISSCVLLLQQAGAVAGVIIFSVTAIFIVPVMFLFGCEGLSFSCLRLPGAVVASGKNVYRLEVLLTGFGILAISVAIQWAVIPSVFSSVCMQLF